MSIAVFIIIVGFLILKKSIQFFCNCSVENYGLGQHKKQINCSFDQILQCYAHGGRDETVKLKRHCEERKKRSIGGIFDDLSDLEAPPFQYDPDFKAPVR